MKLIEGLAIGRENTRANRHNIGLWRWDRHRAGPRVLPDGKNQNITG